MVSKVSAWFIHFFIYLGCNRIKGRILRLERREKKKRNRTERLLTRQKYESVWQTSPWEKLWRWLFPAYLKAAAATRPRSSIERRRPRRHSYCPLLSLVFTSQFPLILPSFHPSALPSAAPPHHPLGATRAQPMSDVSSRVEEEGPCWRRGQRSARAGYRRLQ